jgi:hypoxanthine phosphoribosyltransferase
MPCSKVVLPREDLDRIVQRLGREITAAFCNLDNPLALVLLDGAKQFAEDLLKQSDLPFEVQPLKASSYIGTRSAGTVTFSDGPDLAAKIRGRHILLIDDIYDTGLTLTALMKWLRTCEPASIRTCVLLEKRNTHTREVNIDFVGTPVEDAFLVGYGLDYNGHYRDLPFIGVLSEQQRGGASRPIARPCG